MLRLPGVALVALVACSGSSVATAPKPVEVKPGRGAATLTIIGTNDLHGALDRLPIFGGYVDNLRAVRKAGGGAVLLIDAGDMFQGTLESNLNEGSAVVAAYNALGYAAATVGNHEFDFGPPGPAVTIQSADEDPRGALKARAAEARFPLLTANILDAESKNRIKWPNMPPSTMVEAAGIKVGIIGVTTEATPVTTMPANFLGLAMLSPAKAIAGEAERLRGAGAQLIVVAAHVGSKCKDLKNPTDHSSCDTEEELFKVIEELPAGAVNVIIAGHTHAAMAHRISDIAVVESYASGRAFGRVDVRINGSGTVTGVKIHPPQDLCPLGADGNPVPVAACQPGDYEGRPVTPSAKVAAAIAPALEVARKRSDERLGVELDGPIPRTYDAESPEGNLIADLMLAAKPAADVAMTNGGGLRADLPAGPLTYGAFFAAQPFDNRFALVKLEGRHLRRLVSGNLHGGSGIFSWAGMTVTATCQDGALEVVLRDKKGKVIDDKRPMTLATSDFLASGGDGAIGRLKLPAEAVVLDNDIIRETLAGMFKKRGGKLRASDYYDPDKPRVAYPGKRPVDCGGKARGGHK